AGKPIPLFLGPVAPHDAIRRRECRGLAHPFDEPPVRGRGLIEARDRRGDRHARLLRRYPIPVPARRARQISSTARGRVGTPSITRVLYNRHDGAAAAFLAGGAFRTCLAQPLDLAQRLTQLSQPV